MFVVLITEADLVGAKLLDGKDNPDYSDKEVRAIVKAEVYGNNVYQHELLNFLFNAESADHSVSTAILPNGHEGLQIRFRASHDEYAEFVANKKERELEEKAARGDVDAANQLSALKTAKEAKENAAVATSAPAPQPPALPPSESSDPSKVN